VEQSFTALTRWTPRAGSWWQQERGLPGFNEQLDFYQLLQVSLPSTDCHAAVVLAALEPLRPPLIGVTWGDLG
jgi:hypothetical protein